MKVMKGFINTWTYNLQYGDEIDIGPGGYIMMNGIFIHEV
jgi:hypothetical protein